MIKRLYLLLFTLVLLFVFGSAIAGSSKELRQQQKAAQKDRQAQKKERTADFREAKKSFKEYTKNLNKDYREQVSDIKIEFDLKHTDLQADHETRVAEAATENEKKIMSLFVTPGIKFDEAALESLQNDAKAYSDELFALKNQFAEKVHLEKIGFEERKNELFTEMEKSALDKAEELGMTKPFSAIIAKPVGDTLTKNEERWNEKEQKEVIKLAERNKKLLSKFEHGKKLRDWQIQKMKDDFKLNWEEKSELHEFDAQSLFFNSLMMHAFQGGQVNQKELIDKISEINKKKKMINIKYKKFREKNRILRNKEKKNILKGT